MPNLYQTLVFHSERRPSAVAIADDAGEIGFGAFAQLAVDHARRLQSLGVGKGDRVAVLMSTSRDYLALYYATAVTGFMIVPVNIRLSAQELAWQLQHAQASVLIHAAEFAPLAAQALVASPGARSVSIEDFRTLSPHGAPQIDPVTLRYGCVDGDDVSVIIYTSGTTSRPKGAMLTHDNMAWNAINYQVELALDEQCSAILATPLFHIGGLGVLNGPVLNSGGELMVVSRFDVEPFIDLLGRKQPTHLFLLSAMWVMLTSSPGFGRLRFPRVRYVQTAAAPLGEHRQQMIRQVFPNAEFGWGFGMTETSPTTIKNRFTAEILEHPGSIGYLWRNVKARVVGEDGRVAPARSAQGELQVKGPTVFAGYWRDPEATAAAFTDDGWLRTGDLLRFDADGFSYFLGRLKDMVKTGGENVSALEVEECLLACESVAEAAVYGIAHPQWGEELCAAVVLRVQGEMTASELQVFCRTRLSGFKVPKRIKLVNELPKSSSGKVQKFKLGAMGNE